MTDNREAAKYALPGFPSAMLAQLQTTFWHESPSWNPPFTEVHDKKGKKKKSYDVSRGPLCRKKKSVEYAIERISGPDFLLSLPTLSLVVHFKLVCIVFGQSAEMPGKTVRDGGGKKPATGEDKTNMSFVLVFFY